MIAGMTRTRAAVLACELTFAISLSACRQIVGFDKEKAPNTQNAGRSGSDLSRPDGGLRPGHLTECGGLPYAGDECGNCMRAHCCPQATDCANDPACLAVNECTSQCAFDDVECWGKCNTSIQPAVFDHAAFQLRHCTATSCADACNVGCGLAYSARVASCYQGQQACCDAERALWTNSEAVAWYDCNAHCTWATLAANGAPGFGPDPCGCMAAHPTAKDVADIMQGCSQRCLPHPGDPPDWSCRGSVKWPRVNTGSERIEYHLKLADFQTLSPLPDLRVSQCAASDARCSTPLGPVAITDAGGFVSLTLQASMLNLDYFGYLLVQGDKIPDALIYFFPPVRDAHHDGHTIGTREGTASLLSAPELMYDPSLGAVAFSMRDCFYGDGSGVRVSSEPPGRVAYLAGGLIDPTATETDASLIAVVLNLPPGAVRLQVSDAKTSEPISSVRVFVRAQSVTSFTLHPTPLDN
jgi:hypothetical protein